MEFVQTRERPLTCVTAKCSDANRIIEHVELNFDVNVVVDVSGRGETISNLLVIRKNRQDSSENNIVLFFNSVTLIIKSDIHIL